MGSIIITEKIAVSGEIIIDALQRLEAEINAALSIRPGADLQITQSSEQVRTYLTATIIDHGQKMGPVWNCILIAEKICAAGTTYESSIVYFQKQLAESLARHPGAIVLMTQSSEENQTYLVAAIVYR